MKGLWTKKDETFIKNNIHMTNQELAELLGRTQASIENKVRELGLARTFQKHEVDTLRRVWGRKRTSIEKALPRFTWRQISKKARNIGLPSLKDIHESANLYSIIGAMGVSDTLASKWQELGLRVVNDKGKYMKNSILLVDIDEFWNFAIKHPDVVDLTKIGDNTEDVLGIPPPELVEMKAEASPIPTRIKHTILRVEQKRELAHLFYTTELSTEQLMKKFNVSKDTVRHTAAKYKQPGQKRNTATVVTESFLKQLYNLYYVEYKTRTECQEILDCSASSVDRGIKKIAKQVKSEIQK